MPNCTIGSAGIDGGDAMDSCLIRIRPVEWFQTISDYSSQVEGRRLTVNAKSEHDREFMLSNNRKLHELNINLSILVDAPTDAKEGPLERGIGLFSFHDERPPLLDIDGNDAFVAGWFSVQPEHFAELWDQVSRGGYSDCVINLNVSSVGSSGFGSVWDVTAHQSLYIMSFSVQFTR